MQLTKQESLDMYKEKARQAYQAKSKARAKKNAFQSNDD